MIIDFVWLQEIHDLLDTAANNVFLTVPRQMILAIAFKIMKRASEGWKYLGAPRMRMVPLIYASLPSTYS